MRVHTQFRTRSRLFATLVCICSDFCARASLAQSNDWPLTRNDHLRRVSFLNDDGDVYVESSGTGSEIVLQTGKVRITDGDVYCGISSTEGLAASADALTTKDDEFNSRIHTLNDTHADLQGDLDALDATSSGRFASVDTTLVSLASTDASLTSADSALSSHIDALNATDMQLKATDETLKTRISTLNATDAELKGVDDGLSSRVDALREIYVNELNVTDTQLIVTDATLGSRIDDLNATQYELRGVDTGLSSRLDVLEPLHVEYERIDDEVASLIDSLNATDATMQLEDASLSSRIDALNATNQALSSVDSSLAAQIASLTPPKCTEPGGDELLFNGTHWECVCIGIWSGATCENHPPQKLIPSDARYGKRFGKSISISGEYAVVGAAATLWSAGDGAYVFTRSSTGWTQQNKLISPEWTRTDSLGYSVSIHDTLVVVGAPTETNNGIACGSAHVFVRSDENWTHQQKLIPSDCAANDRFGNSVSISGEYIIVGSPWDDDEESASGSAYVFAWNGTSWLLDAKITASDAVRGDVFGQAVAISGQIAAISAYGDGADDVSNCDGCGYGSVYVFVRGETTWVEAQKLTASDAIINDYFGYSVSIFGDYIAVGAPGLSDNHPDTSMHAETCRKGRAYVFFRNSGGSWVEQQILQASDGESCDAFGNAVAIGADSALVGAFRDGAYGDERFNSGSAYLFLRNQTYWTEQHRLSASDGKSSDEFASSVAIFGTTAMFGAPADDANGTDSGSVFAVTLPYHQDASHALLL